MKLKNPIKVKQGKKNRQAGARFELKVRANLESKGWIVDKWSNNVEFENEDWSDKKGNNVYCPPARLVKVKNKFLGAGKPMMLGAGFPDFISFKQAVGIGGAFELYEIIGVESKSNGKLNKEEKEKCDWYLENKIFSKILIASNGEKRGEIKYKEYQK